MKMNKKQKKKSIWISYDFGIKGDYTGLYTWLDNHQAKECGNGIAYFIYDYSNSISAVFDKLSVEELTRDIKASVKLSKSDRLYIIWKDKTTDKIKGEFINGSRKQSPWEGYGKMNDENDVDEEV